MEDNTLFGVFVQLQIVIHKAVETAVFLVLKAIPEGNDMIDKLVFNFVKNFLFLSYSHHAPFRKK